MRGLVIAAPGTGHGKTTCALALLAGFRLRGWVVQGFKVGPDYIDAAYHAAVSGRPARHLDLWMGGADDVAAEWTRGSRGADLGVVEGVMGLFDTGAPDGVDASTAAVARTLGIPVVLVVDASSMAETAAAVVYGCHRIPGSPGIAGVVLNRVGSARHYAWMAETIRRRTGIPVLGYLPFRPDLALPERHLGLVAVGEAKVWRERAEAWAAAAGDTLDWAGLYSLAAEATGPEPAVARLSGPMRRRGVVAVAHDEAFHFYYTATLELLEALGGEIKTFSPLRGEPIPAEARLLYVGGGFPELFLDVFRDLATAHAAYRARIGGGLTVFAECGGYLWLSESLAGPDGTPVPMVGVVPAAMRFEERLQGFGYREARAAPGGPWPAHATLRGHAFHYSRPVQDPEPPAWTVRSRWTSTVDGYRTPRLAAGFTHIYGPSNPPAVAALWDQATRQ